MKKMTSAIIIQYTLLIIALFAASDYGKEAPCRGDDCYYQEYDLKTSRSRSDGFAGENLPQRRAKRGAYRRRPDDSNIWKGTVNYFFDRTITDRRLIENFCRAVTTWRENTCIEFREYSSSYGLKDVIRVTAERNVCLSFIGKKGGMQYLILGRGCGFYGVAAHEIGHALGLYHTMSRHDRDKYIKPRIENLPPHLQNELNAKTEQQNENYGIPYDYGSIMHYPRRSHAYGNRAVMLPTDPKYGFTMGSHMIAFSDLLMINEHYKCKVYCEQRPETITCKNGGFPMPRDCSKCICLGGYGGDDCSQRPDEGCGEELHAKKNWTTLELRFSNPYPTHYNDYYKKCTYWLMSPNNTRIQVKFRAMHFTQKNDGCILAGVEIKTNSNHTLTGYRRCSNVAKSLKDNFISVKNLVPVIAYTRDPHASAAELTYRYLEDGDSEDDI